MKTINLLLILSFLFASFHGLSQDKGKPNNNTFTNEPEGLYYAILCLKPIETNQFNKVSADKATIFATLREQLITLNEQLPGTNLRLSQIYLGGEETREPVITIRRFDSLEASKTYCEKFEQKVKSLAAKNEIVEILPISQANYRTCLRMKSTREYSAFYKKKLK